MLSGAREHKPANKMLGKQERSISMLIDIQQKLSDGYGSGYEQWAKVFNLKQMARSVSYLSARRIDSLTDLAAAVESANARFDALAERVKTAENRLAEIAVLQKHITDYSKTRNVYIEYRKSGYSKKFYTEHESELLLHKAAKKAFDELKVEKLPSIKNLRIEYNEVLLEKKKAYAEYVEAKTEKRALATAKANIESLIGGKTDEREKRFSEEQKQ